MKLITERLTIRDLCEADYPEFERTLNGAQKSAFGSGKGFLRWILSQYAAMDITHGLLSFGIFEKATEKFVGTVGVGDHDDLHEPEIFYHLLPEYRGQGYAAEAAGAMTEWALSHLPISHLIGTVDTENVKSQLVLERCGYRFIEMRPLLIHVTNERRDFKVYRYEKSVGRYLCKIASLEEMNAKWAYEIAHSGADRENWIVWKERNIENFKLGRSIPYYGILNGTIICEATAMLCPEIVQNSDGLVDAHTVYLSAFRTVGQFHGKGYFSKLFRFMLADLRQKGYKRATLGVEPDEETNKAIYAHYGFTEFLKSGKEQYPDGTVIDVEYYGKSLE